MENTLMEFPAVRTETAFVIQWLEDSGHILGTSSLLIYPTNLLQTLSALITETNLAVLDPDDQLRPLLDSQGVQFVDVAEPGLDKFTGKLVLIGPFRPTIQMTNDLAKQIEKVAGKGVSVVWLRMLPENAPKILPQVLSVQNCRMATIIVASADSIANLADSPRAQLNLIRFCKVALDPKRFGFPHFEDQP